MSFRRHSGAPRSGEPGIHNHRPRGFCQAAPPLTSGDYGFRLSRFALGRNDGERWMVLE
jgi:hypothetical protein